jgi:hypothetical protein
MFTRQLVLLFAGGLLVPLVAESACPEHRRGASPDPVQVTARLYNTARVPEIVKEAALRVAAEALIAGGIHVRWRHCDVTDSCATAPARGELVIRLVRLPGQSVARPKPIVARTLSDPRHEPRLVLGQALIDRHERTGVLATVFVDRVELVAGLSETDAALLMGRAIAHEIGHLLLGTNAHSARGLMRAQWSPADIRRHASADWVLTREDAAAIRRRLQ